MGIRLIANISCVDCMYGNIKEYLHSIIANTRVAQAT